MQLIFTALLASLGIFSDKDCDHLCQLAPTSKWLGRICDCCTCNADCKGEAVCGASGRCVAPLGCITECGQEVAHGQRGMWQGSNYCNECTCLFGEFTDCTEKGCAAREPMCLDVGDVCKSGGVETGPGVQREDDCPASTKCRPLPGVVAIGGEVPHICHEPCELIDCYVPKGPCPGQYTPPGKCCPVCPVCDQDNCPRLRCPYGSIVPPGKCCGQCLPAPENKPCETDCGRTVESGYQGKGDGKNHCNECSCHNGLYSCTELPCPLRLPVCLDVGDVCKSGGVETGPGVQREDDCPASTKCRPLPGVVAIGGEVPHICHEPCELIDCYVPKEPCPGQYTPTGKCCPVCPE